MILIAVMVNLKKNQNT